VQPTRVFLLRHDESAAPELWHGAESDVGLSERGREQIEATALTLAAQCPRAVVSSAMRRAVETARPIAAVCGVGHQVEPALHERRVGILCGQSGLVFNPLWQETLRRWKAGETGYAPPGAESLDAVRQRVLPVWRRLAEQFAGEAYVLVTHAGVIRVLLFSLGVWLGNWDEFHCPNLGLHELRGDGERWALAATSTAAAPSTGKAAGPAR
jgi:probable phosphoglycerate mutase